MYVLVYARVKREETYLYINGVFKIVGVRCRRITPDLSSKYFKWVTILINMGPDPAAVHAQNLKVMCLYFYF